MGKFYTEWEQGFLCVNHNVKFCKICNKDITFATNPQWLGKTTRTPFIDKTGKQRIGQTYNGKFVSPGSRWVNAKMPLTDMFEAVSYMGVSITAELTETEKGVRSRDTFKSHSVVFVDIDSGMTLDDLKTNDFYCEFGAGFYTSPSHKPEHHKFRIIFVLDTPITDKDEMSSLYEALIHEFGGDASCVDPARMFFGTVDATEKHFDVGKRLPDNIVQALIKEARDRAAMRFRDRIKQYNRDIEMNDKQKEKIFQYLLKIKLRPWNDEFPIYRQWRDIVWAMRECGYTFDQACEFSRAATQSKTQGEVQTLWDKHSQKDPVKMGTIIHYISEYLGDEFKKDVFKTNISFSIPTNLLGDNDGR